MHRSAVSIFALSAFLSCVSDKQAIGSVDQGNGVAHGRQRLAAGLTSPSKDDPAPTNEDPHGMRAILRRTASVIEGVVQDAMYTYDEKSGPRLVHTLKVEKVYAGTVPKRSIKLSQLGGPIEDGRFISTSLSEELVIGARYIVFLRADAWFISPLSIKALRVEKAAGREVLVDSERHALKRLAPEGMQFGTEMIPTSLVSSIADTKPASKSAGLESLYGALARSDFERLLTEAVEIEGLATRGTFSEAPTPTQEKWNMVPVAPVSSGDAE